MLSFWDDRGAINHEFLNEIDRSFEGKVFSSKVRRDISVSRAALKGKPLIEIDQQSRALQDYLALAEEMQKRFI